MTGDKSLKAGNEKGKENEVGIIQRSVSNFILNYS